MLYALIHVKWLLHRLLFSEILQTRFQNPFTVFVWSAPPLFHFYFRPFRCRTELKRGESNLGLTQVTTCPYLFSLPIISVPQQLCRLASKFVFRERNIMNGKRFGVPHPIYLSSVQKRGVASRSTDKFIVASHRNRCPHANTLDVPNVRTEFATTEIETQLFRYHLAGATRSEYGGGLSIPKRRK